MVLGMQVNGIEFNYAVVAFFGERQSAADAENGFAVDVIREGFADFMQNVLGRMVEAVVENPREWLRNEFRDHALIL